MTFDDHLAQLVRSAVAEAIAPVREELERLRAEKQEEGIPLTEAAERLHVSLRTVQRMIKRGEIQAVKVGGTTRVRLSEVLSG